jgi:hypothetical protein
VGVGTSGDHPVKQAVVPSGEDRVSWEGGEFEGVEDVYYHAGRTTIRTIRLRTRCCCKKEYSFTFRSDWTRIIFRITFGSATDNYYILRKSLQGLSSSNFSGMDYQQVYRLFSAQTCTESM